MALRFPSHSPQDDIKERMPLKEPGLSYCAGWMQQSLDSASNVHLQKTTGPVCHPRFRFPVPHFTILPLASQRAS